MSLEVKILTEKNWQILIREDLMVELVFSNRYPKDIPKLMIIVGVQFELPIQAILDKWENPEQNSPKDFCLRV